MVWNNTVEDTWEAAIYDGGEEVLCKRDLWLLDNSNEMVAVAGGETVQTANRMSCRFADLRWSTRKPGETYTEIGFWDGTRFECNVTHDSPYTLTMNTPYYDFDVAGGLCKVLSIATSEGGTTLSPPGSYGHSADTNASVLAQPSPGFVLDNWVLDGVTVSEEERI